MGNMFIPLLAMDSLIPWHHSHVLLARVKNCLLIPAPPMLNKFTFLYIVFNLVGFIRACFISIWDILSLTVMIYMLLFYFWHCCCHLLILVPCVFHYLIIWWSSSATWVPALGIILICPTCFLEYLNTVHLPVCCQVVSINSYFLLLFPSELGVFWCCS